MSLSTISEPAIDDVCCSSAGQRAAGMVGYLAIVEPGDANQGEHGGGIHMASTG